MKQKLLLLLALACSLHSWSQVDYKLGAIAGVTMSKIQITNAITEWSYAPNVMVGITVEKLVSPGVFVFANVNYERRTSTINLPYSVTDGNTGEVTVYPNNKTTATVSYISIPVAGRYYFGRGNRFCVNMGLYADVYLTDTMKTEHNITTGGAVSTHAKNYTPVTVGINPGLGYSIPLKNKTDILIDFRYNMGLNYAVKDSDATINSFILAANYRFTL